MHVVCGLNALRLAHTMRLRLRFSLTYATKISHYFIDNNVKIFTKTQIYSVKGPLEIKKYSRTSRLRPLF